MKYIDIALDNLKNTNLENGEPSVLQRVLQMENDPKVASILALDMFLVGIDTVSITIMTFSINIY